MHFEAVAILNILFGIVTTLIQVIYIKKLIKNLSPTDYPIGIVLYIYFGLLGGCCMKAAGSLILSNKRGKVINIVRKLKVLCSISIFTGFVIIIPPAFLILASVASIYIPAKAAHCIGLYVFCLLPLHIDIGIFVVGMFVIIINSILVSRVTELVSVRRDYKRNKVNSNNNNVITRLRRTYRMYKV